MTTTVTTAPSASITLNSSRDPFDGLIWTQELLGKRPSWAYDPQVSAIERMIQMFDPSARPEVTFLAQGAFNKVYKVQLEASSFIFRVTLPTAPGLKTRSEVATIKWVRDLTDLPVPRVLAYNDTRQTEIGFEWILMTELSGIPLDKHWSKLSMARKTALVLRFVDFQACMWRNQLRGIGNIYPPFVSLEPVPDRKKETTKNSVDNMHTHCRVGEIVCLEFFWGGRHRLNANLGPFFQSRDWINARLSLARAESEEALAKYQATENPGEEDEWAKEDADEILPILSKLEILAARLFPLEENTQEVTVMTNVDLGAHNILVNEAGDLTGVLDWECVSALPLWESCYYPKFLQGRPRHELPDIDDHGSKEAETYLEELAEMEKTLLRDIFMDEMRKVEPEFVQAFDSSYLLREFSTALRLVTNELCRKKIHKWVDAVLGGEERPESLRESFGV